MVSILITAGPTREYLDDVRFLSNGSSGRMGFALAEAARADGHEVEMVLGPVDSAPPEGIRVTQVTSALEMQAATAAAFAATDVLIAAAAVADWRPEVRHAGKPARSTAAGATETLTLVANPDIVAGLASQKGDRVVVGFALESATATMAQAVARGRDKLQRKRLDLCVCNRSDAIGKDSSEAVLVFADGHTEEPGTRSKAELARAIVRAATGLLVRTRGPS